MSRLTLQKCFFENLWPLILTENVCDTLSKHMCRFYEPDKTFDNIWLHAYLADRGFRNYQPPTVIRCCFDEKEEKLVLSEATEITKSTALLLSEPNFKTEDRHSQRFQEEEEDLYVPKPVDILPVEQRMAALSGSFEQRRKLAHAFVNRQYPWYMQPPEYDTPFQLTDYIRQEFNGELEKAVIKDIHKFNCKLIIIDLAVQVCLHEMQQWMKFTRYAFIIVVARSQDVVKQVKLMGQNFSAVMMEEDMKYTWQEQLTESLRVGVAHASELGLIEYCTKSFAFVFSRNRNSCSSNAHRILRRKA